MFRKYMAPIVFFLAGAFTAPADEARPLRVAASPVPLPAQKATVPEIPHAMKPPEKDGVCAPDSSGVDYCASSVLPASKTNHYEPSMLFDGNPATAWVEGVSEDGIGETITLHFDRQRSLLGFEIINGYAKNQKIWSANSRVETLEASTGDGQIQVITLKDAQAPTRFDFDAPVETSWLQLKIDSVYRGTKYRDTAISELYPIFGD